MIEDMKKSLYIQLMAVTLLFASCNLAMQPISEVGDGAFYQTPEEINSAVVACYNGLQAPMKYEWMLTELRSDNSRLHTSATTSTDRTMQLDFDQSRISATSEHVYNYWKAVYHNIARCNAVLMHIDVVKDRSADPALIYMSSKLDVSDQVLRKLGAK